MHGNLFIVFIAGRHLGSQSAAHAHQLVSGGQNAQLAMHFQCNLPTSHQLMPMCGAMGSKMATGYENDE
jgi:hypothetical protein